MPEYKIINGRRYRVVARLRPAEEMAEERRKREKETKPKKGFFKKAGESLWGQIRKYAQKSIGTGLQPHQIVRKKLRYDPTKGRERMKKSIEELGQARDVSLKKSMKAGVQLGAEYEKMTQQAGRFVGTRGLRAVGAGGLAGQLDQFMTKRIDRLASFAEPKGEEERIARRGVEWAEIAAPVTAGMKIVKGAKEIAIRLKSLGADKDLIKIVTEGFRKEGKLSTKAVEAIRKTFGKKETKVIQDIVKTSEIARKVTKIKPKKPVKKPVVKRETFTKTAKLIEDYKGKRGIPEAQAKLIEKVDTEILRLEKLGFKGVREPISDLMLEARLKEPTKSLAREDIISTIKKQVTEALRKERKELPKISPVMKKIKKLKEKALKLTKQRKTRVRKEGIKRRRYAGEKVKVALRRTRKETAELARKGRAYVKRIAGKAGREQRRKVSKEAIRRKALAERTVKVAIGKTRKEAMELARKRKRIAERVVKRALKKTEKEAKEEERKFVREAIRTGKRAKKVVRAETRKAKATEYHKAVAVLKKIRKKGLISTVSDKIRGTGTRSFAGLRGAKTERIKEVRRIAEEALKKPPPKINYGQIDFKSMKVGSSVSKSKAFRDSVQMSIERSLGVTSTNIKKYGGEKLFYAIRKRRYSILQEGKKATVAVEGLTKGLEKLRRKLFIGKRLYEKMSYALFNQDMATAKKIATKYGFGDSLNLVLKRSEEVRQRANSVGIEVGYLPGHYPRVVKDYDGLFVAYNKKFGNKGVDYYEYLLKEAADKKLKKVGELLPEERGEILTSALRGYQRIYAGVSQAEKARRITLIPPEFMKYYHKPEDSLLIYFNNMEEKIATKVLFGLDEVDVSSIGSLVDGMAATPKSTQRLKELLTTVLMRHGTEAKLSHALRKTAIVTILGHFKQAITQAQDIALNMSKFGFVKALASLLRKKPFKRDKLFSEMAHELKGGKITKISLKATGFDALDRINNEAFMGNVFREARALSKEGKGKKYDEFYRKLKLMFGDKADDVVEQFKKKEITDDTAYYTFNETLDWSPRVLEEMPENYIRHPNARIAYSMKSWGLKALDIYRNEVIRKWKKHPWQSAKMFVKLTSYLTLAGVTGDQIKDFYLGRKKDETFSEKVWENLMQIMMFNRFDTANIRRDGLGRAICYKAMPPIRWIDDISKDIISGTDKGMRSIRDIPIIGNEIYSRYGRGFKLEQASTRGTYRRIKELPLAERRRAYKALKKEKPMKAATVERYALEEKYEVPKKERKFRSLGVENGERAETIYKYLKKKPLAERREAYNRMKKSKIISDKVAKQLRQIR